MERQTNPMVLWRRVTELQKEMKEVQERLATLEANQPKKVGRPRKVHA